VLSAAAAFIAQHPKIVVERWKSNVASLVGLASTGIDSLPARTCSHARIVEDNRRRPPAGATKPCTVPKSKESSRSSCAPHHKREPSSRRSRPSLASLAGYRSRAT